MNAPGSRTRWFSERILPPLAFAVFVLVAWQLYVVLGDVKESTLPTPVAVAESIWTNRAMLAENAWVTIKEILLGFTLAVFVGVGIASIIRASRRIERAVYPWLVVSQMVPIPAIAPILVIWFGFDMRPKVLVIALVSFFPIAVNTIDGLRAAEPELLNLLKTLKANAWQRFRKAQLPAALPFLFSGLKVAAAFSVIGAVFAEWVGASAGLGYLILVLNNQTATTDMFGVIVVLASIGITLFLIVSLVERLLLPWYYESREVETEGLELEPEEIK
jgi:ABC-type nitrate/sulfonate/bicarbonate transport system permease component